ncbi:MAG: MAPEG family protein [Myxococcota bacterium]
MTTPFWCVLAVLLLPLFLAFTGGYYRGKAFGTADNHNPRAQAAKLEGAGARAYAAQANAWEAAIVFSATILTTHAAGLSAEAATPWALGFVACRVLHGVFYLADLDKARSLAFMGGMACVVTLFVKAA